MPVSENAGAAIYAICEATIRKTTGFLTPPPARPRAARRLSQTALASDKAATVERRVAEPL
jgi:hypothetical protein